MADLPSGTVTLLFTDIEGSSASMKRLGDAWPAVLARHRKLLRGAVEEGDGVVVDCQGDAMFAAFPGARQAVASAADAQLRLAGEAWPEGEAVRVRMALHTGEPHRTEDGYTGIDVVHAARLCGAGHGGQVLLTEATRLLAGAEATSLGEITLPDIDGPETVYQLLAPGLGTSFPPLRKGASAPLEAIGHPGSADERVKRAEAALEDHINNQVAGFLEKLAGMSLDDMKRIGKKP